MKNKSALFLLLTAGLLFLAFYAEAADLGQFGGGNGRGDTMAGILGQEKDSITVTSPNNGSESWTVGLSYNITWTSTGTIANVKIDYSINNGSSWSNIIASTANDDSHPWTVLNTPSTQCLVRISDAANAATSDTSNAVFSIIPSAVPTITITSPNGGESWTVDAPRTITWTATGLTGNVTIDLYKGGVFNSNIGTALATAQTYSWPIPSGLAAASDYKVRIFQGSVSDDSNANFSIVAGTITSVTSPQAGASWARGTSQTITWTYPGWQYTSPWLRLYKGGIYHSYIGIATNGYNYSFSWPIPSNLELGTDYTIRVCYNYSDPNVDFSESGIFSITPGTITYDTDGYNLANVSTIANEFSVWVKVTKNGVVAEPTNEGLRIVDGSNNVLASLIDGPTAVTVNGVNKWGAKFKIEKRYASGDMKVPYFEDGRLQIYDKSSQVVLHTVPAEKLALSVYGTDFDMAVHAYRYENGDWKLPVNNLVQADLFFKAGDIVDNYLASAYKKYFWEAVGSKSLLTKKESSGLCYGMATSSIANYTHGIVGETSAWGELVNYYPYWESETNNSWQKAIDDRWPAAQDAPNIPHKPYNFNLIYSNTYDSNTDNWTLEASKKIMYYFVSQPFFKVKSPSLSEWVGKDNLNIVSFDSIKKLLKTGNPICFSFGFNKESGRHAVVISQMIFYKSGNEEKVKTIIYDNNQSYWHSLLKINDILYSSFCEIQCSSINQLSNINNIPIKRVSILKGENKISVYGSDNGINDVKIIDISGDSQGIYYNEGTGLQKAQVETSQAKSNFSHFDWSNQVNRLNSTFSSGYIEITMIGASSFRVFNNSSNQEIAVIRDGSLDGSQAVYNHEPDNILTMLYLPVNNGVTYRVEVLKDIQIPRLKIFPNVPKDDGTLEASGFDNVQLTNEDATKAIFLVGKDNTDHTMKRTSGTGTSDNVNAQFVESVPVPVPAVDNFNAVVNGLNISLSWDNPAHPHFTHMKIIRKAGIPPTSDIDGNQVFLGAASSTTDVLPSAGTYYYGAFSYDSTNATADWTTIMVDGTLYTISGNVTSGSAGLANASIKLDREDGMSWQTMTSGIGKYSFTNIGNGNYTITSEAIGYSIVNPSRNISINNASCNVDFQASLVNTITLTNPNGGESWIARESHNINWTNTGSITNVKIEYSINNGTNWTTIIASTANTGTSPWTVPAVTSADCLVRVSEVSTGSPSDISNAVFAIAVDIPTIGLSKTSFNFGTERYGTPTPAENSVITNIGAGILNWTATPSVDWLSVLPGSGTGSGVLMISISRTDMSPGYYLGTIAISDPNASNSPQAINVGLNVKSVGTDSPPFGDYATPLDGSTVASSIPVTGWVLDDIGVQSVKIYRGTGFSDRVYIGEALFVKGARPDVEAANPGYPQNDRAGWGYMLLTNFLPNGGNGQFQLLAYATDTGGHEVLLGSKMITCDNLHAVKPFGAIDTPSQGGMASGISFNNFGWALTPQPNTIPIDGSTLMVYVDGLPLGHPVYNLYRDDIATLFPGYANSNGAVGYYTLNTTAYTNGVHTIAWLVMDSGGNADGIGSRYFAIQNVAGGSGLNGAEAQNIDGAGSNEKAPALRAQRKTGIRSTAEIAGIPEDRWAPVYIKRGYREDQPTEMVFPETDGSIRIQIPEVSRVAVYLNENETRESGAERTARSRRILSGLADSFGASRYEAYELVLGQLRPLPIGASFDSRDGVLYWQPGPGFLGEYQFIIIDSETMMRKAFKITIVPGREANKPENIR